MGATGLEQDTRARGKTSDSKTRGAESGAVADEIGPIEPDLQRIIESWPKLSEQVRAGILATIDAAIVN